MSNQSKNEKLKIRPYARLLTMLGEELIKSERIAIVELVKNSYDAFASWATVSFNNFGENLSYTNNSQIIIEDDGEGMTESIIKKHFLNPATPEKKQRKKANSEQTEGKKARRIIQGEKGIGRFSMFKLGTTVEVVTRPKNENKEYVVRYDFSMFDSDFIDNEKALFLDDLSVFFEEREPKVIVSKKIKIANEIIERKPYGTKITITNLRGELTEKTIQGICDDLNKMRPIFVKENKIESNDLDFTVDLILNGVRNDNFDKNIIRLQNLVEEQTVFKITDGVYLEQQKRFVFKVNGKNEVIDFNDPIVYKNGLFKKFWPQYMPIEQKALTACGDFKFSFFIFDFMDDARGSCYLKKEDKELIRQHRVYLYRDGIRVYPYGDPDDDWLQIDIMRGLIKAGQFLSNDQIIGQIDITQKGNPDLQDKTSREGIIEKGSAFNDLIHLMQLFIALIKANQYRKYTIDKQRNNQLKTIKEEKMISMFDTLKDGVKHNSELYKTVVDIEKNYSKERQVFSDRISIVESLAGVGLSVETASHDLMLILQRIEDKLIRMANPKYIISEDNTRDDISSLMGMASFVKSKMKDIQLLFTSSKQKTKLIDVEEILRKIINIYTDVLTKKEISCEIIKQNEHPLMVRTIDAVLMQLFINLLDNACFWLDEYDVESRKIYIYLDGKNNKLIFSDNGPGIKEDDIPYIFDPFYSRKGEEGRGLGLYIARKILERYNYSIDYINIQSEKKLQGANFLIDFITEE